MSKKIFAKFMTISLIFGSCSEKTNSKQNESNFIKTESKNILLKPSPLLYGAPQFDKISLSDYLPAFYESIVVHEREIEKISSNSEKPNFKNTIDPMEKSGVLLKRISNIFFSMSALNSNDDILKIKNEIEPKLTEHNDNIFLNSKLFKRVETIYLKRDSLPADQKHLLEIYYQNFVNAGAKLSTDEKIKIRQINKKINELESKFTENVLNAYTQKSILVTDVKKLDGLSQSEIEALKSSAQTNGKSGYLITLVNTTNQPILSQLKNRELRETIWNASVSRTNSTNDSIAIELAYLRSEKAKILGYRDWASYKLSDQMAKNPQAVFEMLDNLIPKVMSKVTAESNDIQNEMKKDGIESEVKPWDWSYYAEKVRKEKYDLDESEITPYFEFNAVLNGGLFYAMNQLYGIHFKEKNDLPIWNPNVRVFEVFDKDNSSIGLYYLDPYARKGKNGGAWMDELVTQSKLLNNHPVVYNALNIPKPSEGNPTLLTFDEVTTLFHEFGHAIHGLFSNVKYPGVAGTATARDFVEFPSQFNEDWDINKKVIQNFAKHYKTHQPIPQSLLNKILEAHKFNQGYATTEYLKAALLDLEWHTISQNHKIENVEKFEELVFKKHKIDFKPIEPRYKTSYFSHIFEGGYSAGYYSYIWTEVLAADAFAYMKNNGGLTLENGNMIRKEILSKGNSEDLMEIYINFRGQEPTIDALLERRGLLESSR